MAEKKTYTDEQKQEILKYAADTTIASAARQFGVSTVTINRWMKADKLTANKIEAKKKTRATGRKIKEKTKAKTNAAAEKIDEAKLADQMASGKVKAKATRKLAEKKAEKTVKAKAKKPLSLVFQSNAGWAVTPEEIKKKLPKEACDAYIKLEENRIYWVGANGESGSVEIW